MFLTGCVSSLSAQQSFWKEDFSAGKLPDGWMIVDSTKSAKCEWIVTDQPYPGSFQFEQQAPPIASTSRGYHMQFRPGVVTGEEITKWNQREEYPNGYFQTSAIDCAGKNDVVLKFQHLFRWNNWFTGKRAGLWVGVSNDGVNWKEYNVMDKIPAATQLHAPVNEEINISEVAANQKTVYLRFFWRDIFSWYWMVDDIELTEPFAHDLALEKVTSHQETGNTFTKEDVLKVKLKNVGSQPVEPFALPRRCERVARPRRRGTHRVVVRVEQQRGLRGVEMRRARVDVVVQPLGGDAVRREVARQQIGRARLVARHRRSGHQLFEQYDRLGLQFIQSLHKPLRNRFVNPGSWCRPRRAAPRPA